jgi:hypothetical protein
MWFAELSALCRDKDGTLRCACFDDWLKNAAEVLGVGSSPAR